MSVDTGRDAWEKERQRREQDTLYRLMIAVEADGELRGFTQKAIDCMKCDEIFPPSAGAMEEKLFDPKVIASVSAKLDSIVLSGDTATKKALILLALRISRSFVHVFAPQPIPGLGSVFLVDPEKLRLFIFGHPSPTNAPANFARDAKHPLREHISMFLSGHCDTLSMITGITASWMEMQGWKAHDQWRAMKPSAPSLALASNERRRLNMTGGDAPVQHADADCMMLE